MPKISIIIPVYNTAKFLKRSIESAINQTLKDIEIIIVNDGSTDDSKEIINKYKLLDKRIKVIHFNTNHGVSKARNLAISMSTGEFIGFIDSDDYVDSRYYENLYKYNDGEVDVIRGIRLVDGKQAKNPYGCIVPSIIRRKLLISKPALRFPVHLKRGEDSTFKRWLYKTTDKIFECPDNGSYYHYIKREGSLSNYILSNS